MKFLRTLLTVLVLIVGNQTTSWGFSLLGPFKSWQIQSLGYQEGSEIGGHMLASEGYRWNVPTIYYAYDRSFIEYFGVEGIAAVESALKLINDLPPFSSMSADLSEYPLSTKQINYEAEALQLVDLKSYILPMLLEELGLANPETGVWKMRGRVVPSAFNTNYSVIKLNYDPVTFLPSSYVNGALYTYEITEFDPGSGLVTVADEIKVGDLRTIPYSSVAGGATSGWETQYIQDPTSGLTLGTPIALFGGFYTGLTRDDVGGLRYLYRPQRQHVEYLHPDVILRNDGSGGGVWSPVGGGTGTNTFLTGTNLAQALRPGVNKLTFQQVQYDSLLSANFQSFQSSYTDTYITNYEYRTRSVSRVVSRPDIVFMASDLGVNAAGFPLAARRTETTGWQNNAGINTQNNTGVDNDRLFGPGVITGLVEISLSDLWPAFSNGTPGRTGEGDGISATWASYDGNAESIVIYPKFGSVNTEILRSFNLGNNFNSPWTAVTVSVVSTNAQSTTTNP